MLAEFHPWVVIAGMRGCSGCVAVLLWAWRGYEVMVQQSAERRLASDFARRRGAVGILVAQRNVVLDALMRTVLIVVSLDPSQDVFQMSGAKQDQVVQRLPALADESFGEGVALGRARRRLDNSDAIGPEYAVERQKRRVAVMDQEADFAGRFVYGHAEIPRLLAHPVRIRIRRAVCNPNLTGFQVDEEQHIEGRESSLRPNFFGEEIRGPCDIQVLFVLRSWFLVGGRHGPAFADGYSAASETDEHGRRWRNGRCGRRRAWDGPPYRARGA